MRGMPRRGSNGSGKDLTARVVQSVFDYRVREVRDSWKYWRLIICIICRYNLSLEFGRAAGFDVPDVSLVPMPDGMPPVFIERFDIRHRAEDRPKIALEDVGSVLDPPRAAKCDSTMERVVRFVRPLSTALDDDAKALFGRTLFAWFIADGDMHLKNLG
jgi:hypothetical protein